MTTLRKELRECIENILMAKLRPGLDPRDIAKELTDAVLEIAGIKSAEQRREEALQRKAEQTKKREAAGGILGGMMAFAGQAEKITDMVRRSSKALRLDTSGKRFEDMIKFLLLEEERNPDKTIELYATWLEIDNPFSKKPSPWKIRDNPDIVRETWPGAFAEYKTAIVDTSAAENLADYYNNYVPRE